MNRKLAESRLYGSAPTYTGTDPLENPFEFPPPWHISKGYSNRFSEIMDYFSPIKYYEVDRINSYPKAINKNKRLRYSRLLRSVEDSKRIKYLG